MAARGGLLLACKRNMFKISTKLFPYIATPEEVLRLGYSQEEIDKSQAVWKKVSNVYTKIGGSEKTLKDAIRKGSKKIWKGSETPNKAEAKNYIETDPEAAAEAEAEQRAVQDAIDLVQKEGGQQTDDPEIAISKEQVTVQEEVEEPVTEMRDVEVEEDVVDDVVEGVAGIIDSEYDELGFVVSAATLAMITAAMTLLGTIVGILAKYGVFGKNSKKIASVADDFTKVSQASFNMATAAALNQNNANSSDNYSPQNSGGSSFFNTASKVVDTVQSGYNTAKDIYNTINPGGGSTPQQQIVPVTQTGEQSFFQKNKTLLIVGGVIGLAAIAGTVIYVKSKKQEDE
jgi:hypothetical protein